MASAASDEAAGMENGNWGTSKEVGWDSIKAAFTGQAASNDNAGSRCKSKEKLFMISAQFRIKSKGYLTRQRAGRGVFF